MMEENIKVKVKLFSIYQEAFATPELNLVLSEETKVGEVLANLIKQKPFLSKWKSVTRFGVNLEFVTEDTVLHDGDEIVLIPPVSGG